MANPSLQIGNEKWATKDGSLLGYNITDSDRYIPIPADVSRGSKATYVDSDGLIKTNEANVARIDYSSGEGVLLTEPQSRNDFLNSEDFSASKGFVSSVSGDATAIHTSNYGISPNGELIADRVQLDINTGSYTDWYASRTLTNGVTYTYSIYIKSLIGNTDLIFLTANGAHQSISVTDDWVRYTYTWTSTTTSFVSRFLIGAPSSSADILIWGAQLEEQSQSTSYIKTSGSSVTRNIDYFVTNDLIANNIVNQTSGTYFIELKLPEASTRSASTGGIVLGNTPTFPSGVGFELTMDANGTLRVGIRDGVFSQLYSTTNGVYHKIALRWDSLNCSIYVDGVERATRTLTSTDFKYIYSNTGDSPKFIKDIRVYKTALSDAELATLTTL